MNSLNTVIQHLFKAFKLAPNRKITKYANTLRFNSIKWIAECWIFNDRQTEKNFLSSMEPEPESEPEPEPHMHILINLP